MSTAVEAALRLLQLGNFTETILIFSLCSLRGLSCEPMLRKMVVYTVNMEKYQLIEIFLTLF